jgi:hypothetical protein
MLVRDGGHNLGVASDIADALSVSVTRARVVGESYHVTSGEKQVARGILMSDCSP